MHLAKMKQLVADYVEAFNAMDIERLRALFAPDAWIWGVLGHGNLDQVRPIWHELHEGLAMRLEIEALVAEERVVAARLRESGRFVGAFRGLAGHQPTGRSYAVVAMEWFEIEGDRIAQRWGARDFAAISRQVLG